MARCYGHGRNRVFRCMVVYSTEVHRSEMHHNPVDFEAVVVGVCSPVAWTFVSSPAVDGQRFFFTFFYQFCLQQHPSHQVAVVDSLHLLHAAWLPDYIPAELRIRQMLACYLFEFSCWPPVKCSEFITMDYDFKV